MLSEVNSNVENLPPAKKSGQYHWTISLDNITGQYHWTISLSCLPKICLSESGLLRHVKSKHSENLSPNEEPSKLKYSLDISLLS